MSLKASGLIQFFGMNVLAASEIHGLSSWLTDAGPVLCTPLCCMDPSIQDLTGAADPHLSRPPQQQLQLQLDGQQLNPQQQLQLNLLQQLDP